MPLSEKEGELTDLAVESDVEVAKERFVRLWRPVVEHGQVPMISFPHPFSSLKGRKGQVKEILAAPRRV